MSLLDCYHFKYTRVQIEPETPHNPIPDGTRFRIMRRFVTASVGIITYVRLASMHYYTTYAAINNTKNNLI